MVMFFTAENIFYKKCHDEILIAFYPEAKTISASDNLHDFRQNCVNLLKPIITKLYRYYSNIVYYG